MKAPLFGMGGKEFIYLDPPGTPRTATKSGAFDRGNGRREAHGVRGFLAFRQRQRERTVEDIAGSVSTAFTRKVGRARRLPASSHIMSRAPSVKATKAPVRCATLRSAISRLSCRVTARSPSAETSRWIHRVPRLPVVP